MATPATTALSVAVRDPAGSRAARRLRREGMVPGVVYGGDAAPVSFAVDSRVLRQTLSHAGAVLELRVGDAPSTPVVVKELSRHPVTGETVHVDFMRVRLDQAIQATVALELTGEDAAPGVREGGVLEHVVREVTIEALPTDIPDALQHDVSGMQIGETLTLAAITPPPAVKLLDDPDTVVATLTPPRLQTEEQIEIEEETELVAEGATAEQAGAEDGGSEGEGSGE
jgi:large subunit ribosomal protein L25